MTEKQLRCPQCGERALPILWGLVYDFPGDDVILGGCVVPAIETTHGCRACGWQGVCTDGAR